MIYSVKKTILHIKHHHSIDNKIHVSYTLSSESYTGNTEHK